MHPCAHEWPPHCRYILAKTMDVLQMSTSAHTCEATATHENESSCHRSNIKQAEKSCKKWHHFIAANITFTWHLGLLPTHIEMPLPNASSILVCSIYAKMWCGFKESERLHSPLTWHWFGPRDCLAVHFIEVPSTTEPIAIPWKSSVNSAYEGQNNSLQDRHCRTRCISQWVK